MSLRGKTRANCINRSEKGTISNAVLILLLLRYKATTLRLQGWWDASQLPPTFKGGKVVVGASFSETLIFINDLGSQHLQLISTSILREILYAAHPCAGTFSIQLSNHFNLIISSWEALYAVMGSSNTSLPGVGEGTPLPAEGHENSTNNSSKA